MMERFPDRAFDVGIAEQHAVTLAAGMAAEGLLPFCNIYSTFLQRGYDQVIHDVALQNLPVIFCLDRAGLVGQDGPTHHGVFDLAFLRCIPNMIVYSPRNEIELRNILFTAQQGLNHAIAIRYPRGRGSTLNWKQPFSKIEIGTGNQLKKGSKVAFLTVGPIGNMVSELLNDIELPKLYGHFDMRFVKPLDIDLLDLIFQEYKYIITVEDGCQLGGFGSAVVEYANEKGVCKPIKIFAIQDSFIEHGTVEELYEICGLTKQSILHYLESL